jgi:hypothetical protein
MVLRVRQVLAAAILVAACGGRYARVEDDDGGGSGAAASGGSTSQAGKSPGKGGKPSVGGNSPAGGSVGVAGTVSMGGIATAGTGPCLCPDVDCQPGTRPSMQPGNCCPVCEPIDCFAVTCPGIACGPGSELVYPPDQCCPICQSTAECDMGRSGYLEFRKQLFEKYSSVGCMQDAECTFLYEGNACSFSCGTPFPVSQVMSAMSNLDSYAKSACLHCPPQPVPPCAAPPPAACINGRCSSYF